MLQLPIAIVHTSPAGASALLFRLRWAGMLSYSPSWSAMSNIDTSSAHSCFPGSGAMLLDDTFFKPLSPMCRLCKQSRKQWQQARSLLMTKRPSRGLSCRTMLWQKETCNTGPPRCCSAF